MRYRAGGTSRMRNTPTVAPSQACWYGGSNVGTQQGQLFTSTVYTSEIFGQCGTVYVQGRYYAYVGGPSYLSGWQSSPTQAIYNHSNMYWGWHYSSYNTNVQQSWF